VGERNELKILEVTLKVTEYAETCMHIKRNTKTGFKKANVKFKYRTDAGQKAMARSLNKVK